jgi:phage terminase Nu1 subunit (DNA packaging protein)
MVEVVTGAALGKILRMSERTSREYAKKKIFVRSGRGFDRDASIGRYVEHLRAERVGKRGVGAGETLQAERAALLRMQRERVEFELQREKGLWIEAAEVEVGLGAAMHFVRGAMLSIPQRLGVDRRTMNLVDREIRDVLTDVANGHDVAGYSLRGKADGNT